MLLFSYGSCCCCRDGRNKLQYSTFDLGSVCDTNDPSSTAIDSPHPTHETPRYCTRTRMALFSFPNRSLVAARVFLLVRRTLEISKLYYRCFTL